MRRFQITEPLPIFQSPPIRNGLVAFVSKPVHTGTEIMDGIASLAKNELVSLGFEIEDPSVEFDADLIDQITHNRFDRRKSEAIQRSSLLVCVGGGSSDGRSLDIAQADALGIPTVWLRKRDDPVPDSVLGRPYPIHDCPYSHTDELRNNLGRIISQLTLTATPKPSAHATSQQKLFRGAATSKSLTAVDISLRTGLPVERIERALLSPAEYASLSVEQEGSLWEAIRTAGSDGNSTARRFSHDESEEFEIAARGGGARIGRDYERLTGTKLVKTTGRVSDSTRDIEPSLPSPRAEARRMLAKYRYVPTVREAGLRTDLEGLLRSLNINVFQDNTLSGSGYLRSKGAKSVIVLKSSESNERKRFTQAHELGHFVLRSEYGIKGKAHKQKHDPRIERWCDKFAVELLIPTRCLRMVAASFTDMDFVFFAARGETWFGVSKEMFRQRLADQFWIYLDITGDGCRKKTWTPIGASHQYFNSRQVATLLSEWIGDNPALGIGRKSFSVDGVSTAVEYKTVRLRDGLLSATLVCRGNLVTREVALDGISALMESLRPPRIR